MDNPTRISVFRLPKICNVLAVGIIAYLALFVACFDKDSDECEGKS